MAHGHAHGPAGHGHSHDHAHGSSDTGRVLIVAGLTTGFMVLEAVGGLVTGSLALLADAGHMLADAVALWLAWFAFRLADRPGTAQLTYGFGRVKTLVAYTNGLAIFAVAAWICYEAWQRFENPAPILGGPMLAVALAGLAVNIVGFLILSGGDRSSLNMRGAILHVMGDLLGSLAAIAAAIVILWTGWTPIDPILSVFVALLILSSAWSLTRDAAHVLLEGAPREIDREAVSRDIVNHVVGVREVHHMHLWTLDGSKTVATLHARLETDVDPQLAIAAIKARLATDHGIAHATVEPEFELCADGKASATMH